MFHSLLVFCLIVADCSSHSDQCIIVGIICNGSIIYEYILIYTDDILAIGLDPKLALNQVNGYCKLKEGSIGPPNIYLGAKLHAFINPDGKMIWTQSSSAYVLKL